MTNNIKRKKILSYYKKYLGTFIMVMLAAVCIAGISLLIPLCIRYMTKVVLVTDLAIALPKIVKLGILMLFLVLLYTVFDMLVVYFGHMMGAKMESDMRKELFAHYQKLSFSFYDERKVGQLMSRLTNDLFNLSELFHHGPEDVVISSIRFFGAIIILVTINAKLAVSIFMFLPIMAIFSFYFNGKLNKAMHAYKEKIAEINAQIEDNLSGIRVVQSFANEAFENKKFAKIDKEFLQTRSDIYKNETVFYEGVDAFVQLITVVTAVLGGISIIKGQMDIADLLTFLVYVASFTGPVQQLIFTTKLFQEGYTGFERFMELLSIKPDIRNEVGAIDLQVQEGEISFSNVSFSYTKDSKYIFKNISLQIKAGSYVALVGPSGAGKTTFCSLIPRFYEATKGIISIDNQNIKEVSLKSLREHIGIVQQDIYLFDGTIYDNIRYGKANCSEMEVVAAAKHANAHEFINSLPNGYQTEVGQRGVKLSGGQKQRLSIARVFLKNPPILIFDEATSSLDNESEQIVQASLEQLAKDRTTIVIAHRLSTIKNAQRIIVLAENGVEEEGTHQELLEKRGSYAYLYNLQFKV